MKWTLLALVTAGCTAVRPLAMAAAIVLAGSVGFASGRRAAVMLLLVLMAASLLGFSVDAAPTAGLAP